MEVEVEGSYVQVTSNQDKENLTAKFKNSYSENKEASKQTLLKKWFSCCLRRFK